MRELLIQTDCGATKCEKCGRHSPIGLCFVFGKRCKKVSKAEEFYRLKECLEKEVEA